MGSFGANGGAIDSGIELHMAEPLGTVILFKDNDVGEIDDFVGGEDGVTVETTPAAPDLSITFGGPGVGDGSDGFMAVRTLHDNILILDCQFLRYLNIIVAPNSRFFYLYVLISIYCQGE